MPNIFPVRFSAQLRQHLRASRKKLGLTQAQLGVLIGISQARIAEIEANPGLVNFEQLMKLLSVLGLTLILQEGAQASDPTDQASPDAAPAKTSPKAKASRGQRKDEPILKSGVRTSVGAKRTTAIARKNATSKSLLPTRHDPVVRPKKGSW